MSRFVRPSKYRHVYGTAAKKEGCFDNVKVSNNAWDTNLVSTNGKYLALNWNASGGGAFAVIEADRPGKLPDIYPLCRGHTATVLDTAWSPFHEDIVVSGSDDGTFGVWRIDPSMFEVLDMSEKEREKAGGVSDVAPLARINTGSRKVGQVVFHPTAANVVAVSTGDHQVRLYDLTSILQGGGGAGVGGMVDLEPSVILSGPRDSIQSFDFDYTGTRLAVTSRDKQFRIYDARKSGEPIAQAQGHEGVKGARVIWCGDSDRIVTTGFTRTSDRQMYLWNASSLTKPIKSLTLDTSSGVVMPFWSDNQVVFLAGKGDGNIRYYEVDNDEFFELSEHKSTEPQRGLTFAPRRTVNANENEIGKAFKVTGNTIQPISFQVPRRAETFQSDIFPPAASDVPALSASEFFSGKQAPPNLISLEDGASVKGTHISRALPTPSVAPVSSQLPAFAAAPRAPSPTKPLAPSEPVAVAPAAAPASSAPASKEQVEDRRTAVPEPNQISRPVSPVKSGATLASARPAVENASSINGNGATRQGSHDAGEISALREEVELLKEEMAKRDTLIRKLEVENERLRANERRVRDAIIGA